MRGRDIITALDQRRTDQHCFVKWWRKEEDFLDFDLIDRFMANVSGTEEIGGIDLLTMDEMWDQVRRVSGTRVKLIHNPSGDTVEWVHKSQKGLSTHVCSYTPEALLQIFDSETKGNPVDS